MHCSLVIEGSLAVETLVGCGDEGCDDEGCGDGACGGE